MNAAAFRRFNGSAAALRQKLFGATETEGQEQLARMEDGGAAFPCYYTPVRSQEQLDRAAFRETHDTILRVRKSESAFEAIIGRSVRILGARPDGSDLVVRITEFGFNRLNPEWVAGCHEEF